MQILYVALIPSAYALIIHPVLFRYPCMISIPSYFGLEKLPNPYLPVSKIPSQKPLNVEISLLTAKAYINLLLCALEYLSFAIVLMKNDCTDFEPSFLVVLRYTRPFFGISAFKSTENRHILFYHMFKEDSGSKM